MQDDALFLQVSCKNLSKNAFISQESSKKEYSLQETSLLQESCKKQMRLVRILQELCYSCNKNKPFSDFLSPPKNASRCGNEGFQILDLQVVLTKEGFNH